MVEALGGASSVELRDGRASFLGESASRRDNGSLLLRDVLSLRTTLG
jgi:hypothetical protein